MDLPAEILLQILDYVEPRDRFNCLTVCRQWSAPVGNSLYAKVHITSFDNFVKFADEVRYDTSSRPHSVVAIKLVNTGSWNLYKKYGRQETIKRKLKTVAERCVNLRELDFDDYTLWVYLDSAPIAWEQTWLKLTRLPPYGLEEANRVYRMLKHRLTSAKLIWPETKGMIDVLLSTNQLESLELDQSEYVDTDWMDVIFTLGPWLVRLNEHRRIDLQLLKKIHTSLPKLKHLKINCPISNLRTTNSAALPPLEFLKSFSCHVNHPSNAWFPIIKANFSHMTDLDINITIDTILKSNEIEYSRKIASLYKQIKAKKITISFNKVYCAQSISKFMYPILQTTKLIVQPEISITLDIYDRKFLEFVQEEYRISSNYHMNKDEDDRYTARHDLQIKSVINTDITRGEIASISGLVNVPLRKVNGKLERSLEHVVTLKLKRWTLLKGEEKFHLSINHLLAEFPQLQYLVVSSEDKVTTGNTHYYGEHYCKIDVNFRQSPRKYFVEHRRLETIRLEHLCLGIFFFNFLMGWCPNLKSIHMIDCVWDCNGKYTTVDQHPLWYKCARNVKLYVNNKEIDVGQLRVEN